MFSSTSATIWCSRGVVRAHYRRPVRRRARRCRSLCTRADGRGAQAPETNIDEIYKNISSSIIAPEVAQRAIAREIEVESSHLILDRVLWDALRLLKKAGRKIVLASDFYMYPHQMLTLLERSSASDASDVIDKIYISCMHGREKGNGLFATILDDSRLPAAQTRSFGR